MRLCGSVEVSDRQLPSLNLTKRRAERSYLSIGTFPGKNKEPFVLLQTMKNTTGVKYKVVGNVESVFTRYISEGKVTLRFKSPPHDLIVNCPSAIGNLRSFLLSLKVCLGGGTTGLQVAPGQLSNLAAAPKLQPKPKTKFSVSSKRDYPHLEGFPRTLESLEINGVEMVQLDRRILRLQNLRVLNLEDNRLCSLPSEIDLLPNLRELRLAKNCLGEGSPSSWRWMLGRCIRSRLQVLDLRNNKLMFLPKQIVKLRCLKSLLLDHNRLTTLPNGIGLLSSLQDFQVNHNSLMWLPGSCRKMRLYHMDVSFNRIDLELLAGLVPWCSVANTARPHSLLDLSAQAVLNARLKFSEESLPRTVVDYLEEACYCECGRSAYPTTPEGLVPYRLSQMAGSASYTADNTQSCVLIAVRFCRSTACAKHAGPTARVVPYSYALEKLNFM